MPADQGTIQWVALEKEEVKLTIYFLISILLEVYHEVMYQSFLETFSRLEAAGCVCASKLTVNALSFCQRFIQNFLVTHLLLK